MTGDRLTSIRWLSRLRSFVIGVVLVDLLLIIGQVLTYRRLLEEPNSITDVLEPVALLLAYAAATFQVTASLSRARHIALREGSILGRFGGVLFIINLASETFVDRTAHAALVATAPFFLGTFMLWGVASYRAARLTRSLSLGILAAVWSAMCTILLTITFGFILAYVALSRLERNLATSPEFARSGSRDLHAFAIANQFEAAASHLLVAVVIAMAVGLVGSLLGRSAGDAIRSPAVP